jgi:uncharacterized protein (TIGR03086 family)
MDSSSRSSARYRTVADRFDSRVREMPTDAWDLPSPCDGWVGRDIVTHLVSWIPAVIGRAGVEIPMIDDPQADPVAAWRALDAGLRRALDDPAVAGRTFDAGPPGELTVAGAIDMLVVGDLVIHTWDLARTGGLDEELDADIVAEMLDGMEPLDEMLRASGHYGARVAVADDADEQTKLIAFTGRTP